MVKNSTKLKGKWIGFLFILMCFFARPVLAAEPMPIFYYFYSEYCLSCHTGSELEDAFYKTAKQYLQIPFGLIMANIAEQYFYDLYKARYDVIGETAPELTDRVIFFGNKKIEGRDNIELNLPAFLEGLTEDDIYTAMLQNSPVPSGINQPSGNLSPAMAPVVVYFYVSFCESCEKASIVLEGLPEGINIFRYNINDNNGILLIRQYFSAYHVPDRQRRVPMVFVGGKYLGGDEISAENLSVLLKSEDPARTLKVRDIPVVPPVMPALEWTGILLTGLLNGLNPCGLSMLLFFVSLLTAKGARLFWFGFLYTVGRFTAYLVLGTAGYHVFLAVGNTITPGIRILVKFSLAAVSFTIACFSLHDYFAAKIGAYEKIRLQLPKVFRQFNHNAIRRALDSRGGGIWLSIFCFLLGILISAGEFLCTGQIFLAGILYALRQEKAVLGYFLWYITALVLPGLILLVSLWRGRTAFQTAELVRRNMAHIKLLGFIFFLLFAVLIMVFG